MLLSFATAYKLYNDLVTNKSSATLQGSWILRNLLVIKREFIFQGSKLIFTYALQFWNVLEMLQNGGMYDCKMLAKFTPDVLQRFST